MQITITLPDKIAKQLKTLSNPDKFICEVLEIALQKQADSEKTRRIKLPTFQGDGLQPNVDLTNSRALQNIMDEHGFTRR